jgi:cation:H+ antiporter
MLLTIILFIVSAGAIYFACEYFVNGVEWVGRRLELGATATGTVLAAFGTALPETAVTFMAVVLGRNAAQRDIGVGAALGGPLVLATIAYATVGVVLLLNRKRLARSNKLIQVDHRRLSRDQAWFLGIFIVNVVAGLFAFAFKPLLGVMLLVAYALYVWREMCTIDTGSEDDGELEPLKLRPRDPSPPLGWAALQTIAALIVITIASRVFVSQLEAIGTSLHMAPHLVALLLSPVATELPETINALIWVRQGRERLALANISGAMMIQATIPSALGLMFTPWLLDAPLIAAGTITALATITLWAIFRRGSVNSAHLIPVGLLYGVFAAAVLFLTHRG